MRKDTPDLRQAKYRELEEYSRSLLLAQQGRFARVDEKAARQMSAVTVVLGAAAFFCKWGIDELAPPRDFLSGAILLVGATCVAFVVAAFWKLFAVLATHEISSLPLDGEYLEFVRTNLRVDVNYHTAKTSVEAYDDMVTQTHAKTKLLATAYRLNRVAIVLLALVALLYGAHRWQSNASGSLKASESTPSLGIAMHPDPREESSTPDPNSGETSPADSSSTDPNEPDLSIDSPKPGKLTESFDPDTLSKPEPEVDG